MDGVNEINTEMRTETGMEDKRNKRSEIQLSPLSIFFRSPRDFQQL